MLLEGIKGGERLALEEIREVEATAEDAILVDVENRVSGQARVARDVAMVEDGD